MQKYKKTALFKEKVLFLQPRKKFEVGSLKFLILNS
jgi:hypothetical protein